MHPIQNAESAAPEAVPAVATPEPAVTAAVITAVPETPDPDVGFTMAAEEPEVAEQARRLVHRIAQELISEPPEGWQQLRASFAVTVTGHLSRVSFFDGEQRRAEVIPSGAVLNLVVEHRALSATLGDGPWWRLELLLNPAGELTVDHDYGDEPFPADQLFSPQDYLADLEVYPRATLQVWLAAHIFHGDRQSRPPRLAAVTARADRESDRLPAISENDFPNLPMLWSRWAAVAAAFVAVGSDRGPRVLPSCGWFEGSRRSGSSLYLLPGDRAVLSGGVWEATELATAYRRRTALPDLYRGAPDWVANPVLNTRAAGGLLTFCYWWEHGRWHRGDSPSAPELTAAVPGIWTAVTVADVISGLIPGTPTPEQRSAITSFVAAAERRDVTPAVLAAAFGDAADVDTAHYQLTLSGVARIGAHHG